MFSQNVMIPCSKAICEQMQFCGTKIYVFKIELDVKGEYKGCVQRNVAI